MMNENKKRKSKIRFKKLLVFLVGIVLLFAVVLLGIGKGIQFVSSYVAKGDGRPVYYLFIGTDEKAGNEADSILLLARNDKKQEATFISIPPNAQIRSRKEGENMLLRKTFTEGGAEETKSAMENLLHIRIDKYAVINFSNFQNYLSHVGPIDMYVEQSMEHVDASGNTDIAIHQGYQSLSDENALGYMRFMDPENGEVGRIQRQERFMKIVLQKMQSSNALYNWGMVKHYWNAIETDITPAEAGTLAYHLSTYPASGCKFVIFPGELQKLKKDPAWIINPVEAQKVIAMTMEQ